MNTLFYSTDIQQEQLVLTDQEAVHCSLVLRKRAGDFIFVVDGRGMMYNCSINSVSKREVVCQILDRKSAPNTNQLSLAVSPTKNRDRLEWIVEKVVELGVRRVIFLNTERTERSRINMERVQKKAVGAMKQSLQLHLPEFIEMEFSQLLEEDAENKLIAHCLKDKKELSSKDLIGLQDVLLLIGPEGDFTTDEVQAAVEAGFKTLDLGSSRLRTETAAIAVAAICNAK